MHGFCKHGPLCCSVKQSLKRKRISLGWVSLKPGLATVWVSLWWNRELAGEGLKFRAGVCSQGSPRTVVWVPDLQEVKEFMNWRIRLLAHKEAQELSKTACGQGLCLVCPQWEGQTQHQLRNVPSRSDTFLSQLPSPSVASVLLLLPASIINESPKQWKENGLEKATVQDKVLKFYQEGVGDTGRWRMMFLTPFLSSLIFQLGINSTV